MNFVDILFSANESSELTGKIFLFSSGLLLCLEPIINAVLPTLSTNSEILFNACRLSLFWCLLGALYYAIKYRNILHPSTKNCLKCGSKMEYTSMKCLDEKGKGCNFSIELDSSKTERR